MSSSANNAAAANDLKTSAKKGLLRDGSPTQTAMRTSFYSMSLLNEEEKAEVETNEHMQSKNRLFEAEQERRGAVLDQLNITNILELS